MLRNSLVPPPPESEIAADLLSEAADALLAGDEELARTKLSQADMRVLYDYSNNLMNRVDKSLFPKRGARPAITKAPARMPSSQDIKFAYARDGWRCRFCNCRVVQSEARDRLRALLPGAIKWGKHEGYHGAFYALMATPDHVVPHAVGGTNDIENIVTTCWPCNFAKEDDTIEHLGLNDPRLRAPIVDDWKGLTQVLARPAPNKVLRDDGATAAENVAIETKAPKMRTGTPKLSTSKLLTAWSDKMNRIEPNLADRLIAFAESCAEVGATYSIQKVMVLRLQADSSAFIPIAVYPIEGVLLPETVGPYKDATRNFAIAMAEALPNGVAYETPKMWNAKIQVANGKRRNVTALELLDIAEQARRALAQLNQALNGVPD